MASQQLSRPARLEAALRALAALVGTLPIAVLGGACLSRFAPLTEEARFILGYALAIPLWVAAMCLAFLARTAARAWAVCAAISVMLAALTYGVPQ
ncbi:hypothetical protein SOCE26_097170 [Sorangium cellulosum]|uniref:Iron uptake protein n=1 Tax=Sorangium cellulosum TaxID=56 RepID=A0A2L0F9C1_SORCE|nr:hypothetical protein [Sorangium cellulosum]AUX48186.1 hypothetical protein SOCE26_097170 [Sorangium cellulosum]